MADPIPTKTKTETLADIAAAKAAANVGSSKWTGEKFGSNVQHSDADSDLIAKTREKSDYVIDTLRRVGHSGSGLKTSEADLAAALLLAKNVNDVAKYGPKVENVESNADKLTNTGITVTPTNDEESSAGMGLK